LIVTVVPARAVAIVGSQGVFIVLVLMILVIPKAGTYAELLPPPRKPPITSNMSVLISSSDSINIAVTLAWKGWFVKSRTYVAFATLVVVPVKFVENE
jgi:hypothetical protein